MSNKSYFSKVLQAISGTFFSRAEYPHDGNYSLHDNYNITDTTELRLISSRRTFL